MKLFSIKKQTQTYTNMKYKTLNSKENLFSLFFLVLPWSKIKTFIFYFQKGIYPKTIHRSNETKHDLVKDIPAHNRRVGLV